MAEAGHRLAERPEKLDAKEASDARRSTFALPAEIKRQAAVDRRTKMTMVRDYR